MISGTKSSISEFAGTKTKQKNLKGLKPKNTLFPGTKIIFKPNNNNVWC
jgi:hypothetical protein